MTDDLIKRAREALDGVTPGPWNVLERYSFITHKNTPQVMWDVPNSVSQCLVADTGSNTLSCRRDARFIAAARDLVPAMIDRIETLTAEVARLRETTIDVKTCEDLIAAAEPVLAIALQACEAENERMRWLAEHGEKEAGE